MRLVLYPFSLLFLVITFVRNIFFDYKIFSVYRSTLPVLSIGNLTVGGTGKTPLTVFFAKALREEGRLPVVLSRGYKGTCKGAHVVDPERPDACRVYGDEPVLISKKTGVPVIVAKNRVEGAKLIEDQKLGNVILMDDGMQHRWLHRNIDIAAIDVSTPHAISEFKKGYLLPVGRFREEKTAALRRASYIALSLRRFQSNPVAPTELLSQLGIPHRDTAFTTYFKSTTLQNGKQQVLLPSNEPTVTVFSGIANPHGFYETVRALGFTIDKTICFPDHHSFSTRDLVLIEDHLEAGPVVTTEKDWVRLPDTIKDRVFVLSGELEIYPKEFISKILVELRTAAVS